MAFCTLGLGLTVHASSRPRISPTLPCLPRNIHPLKMAHQIEDVDIEEDSHYDENADEDFTPDTAGADEDASSSSEDEAATTTVSAKQAATKKKATKKRKSDAISEGLEDLDSGDEATIRERQRGKKKRRKGAVATATAAAAAAEQDDDSGGEGGLIKTRAQRLAEKVERKQRRRAREGEVTVDVDTLWVEMSRLPVGRAARYIRAKGEGEAGGGDGDKENAVPAAAAVAAAAQAGDGGGGGGGEEEMVTIKRRIEYAGEITEVEERVSRNSKEAEHYFATHPEIEDNSQTTPHQRTLHRPLKRPSHFEPNPHALVKNVSPEKLRPKTPSRLDVILASQRAEAEAKKRAEKMTTVQKSALDWRGFVEAEGLREELDVYGKSKRGYLEREEFLGRVGVAQEVRGREARLKG